MSAYRKDHPALRHLPPVALFAALTVAVTWPVCLAPARCLEAIADQQLNSYILAWGNWALRHQLFAFFHANTFFPHTTSLAYGEHLIAQMLMALPVGIFDPPAPLLHNLSLMQGYFFSALGAYALAWYFWRRAGAACVAGALYGFAAYRVAQSGHIQLIHGEFLPLAMLGFELAVRSRGRRGTWLLAAAALGQWLTSWYWAIFSFYWLAPYFIARLWRARRRLAWSDLPRIFGPLALACAVMIPVALPYLDLKERQIMVRPRAMTRPWWARPADFVLAPPRNLAWGATAPALHARTDPERYLFPGAVAVAGLAAAALALTRERKKTWPSRAAQRRAFAPGMWMGLTAFMLGLSLGPQLFLNNASYTGPPNPLYWLADLMPAADQVRVPARWMLPATLGIAMLGAYAWASWLGGKGRGKNLARVAVLSLLAAECLTRPMDRVEVAPQPRPIWQWLEAQPFPTPVLILPTEHPTLLLDAAAHHQPVFNGSNGYFPPNYKRDMDLYERFPSPASITQLEQYGARWVLIDLSQPGQDEQAWRERLDAFTRQTGRKLNTMKMDGYLGVELEGRIHSTEGVGDALGEAGSRPAGS